MSKSRFTLVEILVAIVIILILAGMLFPIIKSAAEKADHAATIDRMQTIMKALDEYKDHYGYYPQKPASSNLEGYQIEKGFFNDWAGIPKYSGKTPSEIWKSIWAKFESSGFNDPYLTDPYEGSFYYLCPGTMNKETFDLWSCGPDEGHGDYSGSNPPGSVGNAQTRDDNDDVTNWKSDFN